MDDLSPMRELEMDMYCLRNFWNLSLEKSKKINSLENNILKLSIDIMAHIYQIHIYLAFVKWKVREHSMNWSKLLSNTK